MTASPLHLSAAAGRLREGSPHRGLIPVAAEGARGGVARVSLSGVRDKRWPRCAGDIHVAGRPGNGRVTVQARACGNGAAGVAA